MLTKNTDRKSKLQSYCVDSNENRKGMCLRGIENFFRNGKTIGLALTLLLTAFAGYEASAQTRQQAPPVPEIIQQINRRNQNPLGQNPNSIARYERDKYKRLWYFDGSRWYLWTGRKWLSY